jgi:biotin carboxylase
MENNRTLLIISGGLEAVPGIKIARDMGLHVVVSDMDPQAPGFEYAHDRLLASTYDVPATIRAVMEYQKKVRKLDGVICIAADVPLTVASVAAEFGLPGIPIQSAELASDKLSMKNKFDQDHVPIPWYSPINSIQHLQQLIQDRGFPLIIKPVDSRGARGVIRLTEDVDVQWAYHLALSYSPAKRIMLETFLTGPQISTESFVVNDSVYTPGFSDRNYSLLEKYAPHVIEDGGDLPSYLPDAIKKSTCDLVVAAAKSMGVRHGTVKGDIVIHKGIPYIIELAPRLSGGYFCTHTIPLNTGVEFVKQAIRLALGEAITQEDTQPKFKKNISQRFLFPKPGKVTRVYGYEEVSARKDITLCEIYVQPGDYIGKINCHPSRSGVVIATGENRQDAINHAVSAINTLKIKTVPL